MLLSFCSFMLFVIFPVTLSFSNTQKIMQSKFDAFIFSFMLLSCFFTFLLHFHFSFVVGMRKYNAVCSKESLQIKNLSSLRAWEFFQVQNEFALCSDAGRLFHTRGSIFFLFLKRRQFQHETAHATGEKKTFDLIKFSSARR